MPFFKRKSDKEKGSPASPALTARSQAGKDAVKDHHSMDIPNGAVKGGVSEDKTPYAWGERPKSLLLDPNYSAPGSDGFMVLNDPLKPQTPMVTSSRLSKTFHEVLHDKDALPYFREFMCSQGAEHIVQFWLDAESFQASSWTRIRSQSKIKSQTPRIEAATISAAASGDSASEAGYSSQDTATACTNCDKTDSEAGSACSNNCDKGEDHPVEAGSALQSGTSHCAINTTEPAGRVPSNHSNPPDAASKQSDSSNHNSSSLPIEKTTQVSISESSQITKNSDESSSSQSAKAVDGSPSSPTSHSQPVTSPVESPPTSPTADTNSFQNKLKKSIQRDAVSIFSKYLSHDASHPIGITEELRNEVMSKMCGEDGEVDPQSFVSCQQFAVRLMEDDYFPGFLSSEFHCKHQVDLLTTTNVNLADILYNDVAMFYFSEFMEQESGSKLLQCFLAIHNFQEQLTEQYGSYDAVMAQSDAMVIYDKYFSLQATSPLGFSDDVRFEVEGNICREGGPLPDCFATAKRQVLRTIDKVYFPQFVMSDLYFKYLGELINTVQTQDIPGIRRKRLGSDASSEHSLGSHSTGSEKVTISAKNTLLASANQTVTHMRKAFNKVDDDMQIDSALFNPDELWKRPQAGRLTLGKINELGQFVSDIEPEPDIEKKKKSPFILKKKKEKEKTQEEMAQQIAQMIISDINTATGCDLQPPVEGQEGSTGQGQSSDLPQESSLLKMSFGGGGGGSIL